MRKMQGELLLVLTAVIWGMGFVSQHVGADQLGPFTFHGARSAVGALSLLPLMIARGRAQGVRPAHSVKTLLLAGLCCGLAMYIGSILQIVGQAQTSVGKAGFITALYILIVPILGLLLGRRVRPVFFASVLIALGGMYLLSITEDFGIGRGDLLVLLCAVMFAVHILLIDHFSPKVDGVALSFIQLVVNFALSIAPVFTLEAPSLPALLGSWLPILYSGVLSCALAFTLQIVAQKRVSPVVASLIMSLESVFAALFGWLLLGQGLSSRELLGCALVFTAVILAQLPGRREERPPAA